MGKYIGGVRGQPRWNYDLRSWGTQTRVNLNKKIKPVKRTLNSRKETFSRVHPSGKGVEPVLVTSKKSSL